MLVLGTYGEHETFFTLKGELEAVLTGLRVKKPSYTAVRDNPTYHPGRCAKLTVEGVDVGFLVNSIPWPPRTMAWTERSIAAR